MQCACVHRHAITNTYAHLRTFLRQHLPSSFASIPIAPVLFHSCFSSKLCLTSSIVCKDELVIHNASGEGEAETSAVEQMYFQTPNQAKLEEGIAALEGVPNELIEQIEKSQEKQRRLALREEKMEKQRMEQERRAERSLERAHAPIPRKTGKPIMFRSQLFKKKKLQVTEVKTDDDKELIEFLERDF